MSRQMQTKPRPSPKGSGSRGRPKPKQKASPWKWVGFFAPLAVIAALVVVGSLSGTPEQEVVGSPAPDFVLPTSTGETVSLDSILETGGEALLYFSMGVGCDGCFAQIPEIDAVLADRNITLVPIMVDAPDLVASEAVRFEIGGPILIDADRSVSSAYDMMGIYGHADRPSHSFALVGQDRQIQWVHHYATMFVPADDLLQEMGI